MTTYAGFETRQVIWGGTPRATFVSSPAVQRSFCPRCGTPVSFAGDRWPGELHLFVASFDEPESLLPQAHVHVAEKLSWLHLSDSLPKYPTTARDGPPLP